MLQKTCATSFEVRNAGNMARRVSRQTGRVCNGPKWYGTAAMGNAFHEAIKRILVTIDVFYCGSSIVASDGLADICEWTASQLHSF